MQPNRQRIRAPRSLTAIGKQPPLASRADAPDKCIAWALGVAGKQPPLASRALGAPNECVADLGRNNILKCCADLRYFGLEGVLVLGRGQCQEQCEAMSR